MVSTVIFVEVITIPECAGGNGILCAEGGVKWGHSLTCVHTRKHRQRERHIELSCFMTFNTVQVRDDTIKNV